MMQPLPNVSQAYRLFAQEERHNRLSKLSSQTEAMSFYADRKRFNNQGQRNFSTSNSVSPGLHKQNYMPNRNVKPASKYFCINCQIARHIIERCFKIHGYPPGFQAKQERKVVAFSHQTTDTEE